ncbi:MAG: glycosyltransferase family 9 protein [Gammaproteobacteria bacterium]
MLFPTHYLGNFILGMPWVCDILHSHPDSLLVLDHSFAPLARMIVPPHAHVLYYPRAELQKNRGVMHRWRHYWRFLSALRRQSRHTLVDLEGERFSGVISLLSGCTRRIGPTGKRADRFYTELKNLDYQAHRFNAFREIAEEFVSANTPGNVFSYLFPVDDEARIQQLLPQDGSYERLVAIHPGASVAYKLWPSSYFEALVPELEQKGFQVIWVGAGTMDAAIIDKISASLPQSSAINLCNQLSLTELATLFSRCQLFIGSDSGPMHLAASTGLTVLALFGPSDENIWAPLGENSHVLRGEFACAPECDASICNYDHRCLSSLHPAVIMQAIENYCPLPRAGSNAT